MKSGRIDGPISFADSAQAQLEAEFLRHGFEVVFSSSFTALRLPLMAASRLMSKDNADRVIVTTGILRAVLRYDAKGASIASDRFTSNDNHLRQMRKWLTGKIEGGCQSEQEGRNGVRSIGSFGIRRNYSVPPKHLQDRPRPERTLRVAKSLYS
jgi:hypothetical protein